MCDYCSCRSMPVLQDLGAEHEDLLALSEKIRGLIRTGQRSAASGALALLVERLDHHTDIEESSIFAGLRSAGEMLDHVDALAGEHGAMRDAVELLSGFDGAAWDDRVREILDDLHDHIVREEYDLFPATLLAIGPSQWDAVETAAREARHRAA